MASLTSASASSQGLPASSTIRASNRNRRASISSAARSSTAARSAAGVRAQPGKAARAAASAASTSAGPAEPHRPTTTDGCAGSTETISAAVRTSLPAMTSGYRRPSSSPTAASASPIRARGAARVKSALAAFRKPLAPGGRSS